MRKGEITDGDATMLASLEGTLEEYNEGREVQFVLVNIKKLEDSADVEPLDCVEVIGNMPQGIVRLVLTKVLMSLISDDIHDRVCDDRKDKTH